MDVPHKPICVVIEVHRSGLPPDTLYQVTLRPDKFIESEYIIRLGETPGDEFTGWVRIEHINIVAVLGEVNLEKNEVTRKAA